MSIPTPKIPFSLPITTLLYCPSMTVDATYDPDTGNYVSGNQKVVLKASLVDSGDKGDFGQQPGLNVGVTWFTGYIVSPVPLPSTVRLIGTVEAKHTYASGITQTGLFTVSETPNAFPESVRVAGIPITGMFKNAGGK